MSDTPANDNEKLPKFIKTASGVNIKVFHWEDRADTPLKGNGYMVVVGPFLQLYGPYATPEEAVKFLDHTPGGADGNELIFPCAVLKAELQDKTADEIEALYPMTEEMSDEAPTIN
jgi:hypothetical protein